MLKKINKFRFKFEKQAEAFYAVTLSSKTDEA